MSTKRPRPIKWDKILVFLRQNLSERNPIKIAPNASMALNRLELCTESWNKAYICAETKTLVKMANKVIANDALLGSLKISLPFPF